MPRIRVAMDGHRCTRCGHEWVPRKPEHPRVCPKCKSPFWDRERQILGFRAEALIQPRAGQAPTATQLQRLERRLGPRRPAIRPGRAQTRVEYDVQAINEATAQVTARRVLSAAVSAVGLGRPTFTIDIRSVRRRTD